MAVITFEEYQLLASRTANDHEYEGANYAMGLAGESGELIDIYKKSTFHGHSLPIDSIKKEAGDVLWYTSQLMRKHQIIIENVFNHLNEENEVIKKIVEKGDVDRITIVSCLNLSKHVGEVSGYIDGSIDIFSNNDFALAGLKRSLKIVLINLHYLIRRAGLTIEEVAEANIEKLKRRYPSGFSSEASINRPEE